LVDVSMKTFSEVYAGAVDEAVFLLFVFAVACLIGVASVVRTGLAGGGWPRPEVYTWGIGLGIVNYGSAAFLLLAIERLSGPFVFPVNHISVVLGAALLGVLAWGERLSRANWLGLAVAGLALALLWNG
jgi:drug/metabolite transporter (DMT)-like permease